VSRLACDIDPAETYLPAGRALESRENVDQRCLARAIGSDQAEDFAAFECEAYAADRRQAAEGDDDVLCLELLLARLADHAMPLQIGSRRSAFLREIAWLDLMLRELPQIHNFIRP
jgi:hypothetical protein